MARKKKAYVIIGYLHVAPPPPATTLQAQGPTLPEQVAEEGNDIVEVEVDGRKIRGKILNILPETILLRDERGRLIAIPIEKLRKSRPALLPA